MKTNIPKISEDIKFTKFSKNEYLLLNWKNNYYVKISEEVYNLISLADGEKNIGEIAENFQEKFSHKLSEEFIYELIYNKLQPYGLLENQTENLKLYEKPSYLKLSFIIFPEKFLRKITPYFYFLFNPKIAIAVILLNILILCANIYQNFDLYSHFSLQKSLVYFFVFDAFQRYFS